MKTDLEREHLGRIKYHNNFTISLFLIRMDFSLIFFLRNLHLNYYENIPYHFLYRLNSFGSQLDTKLQTAKSKDI